MDRSPLDDLLLRYVTWKVSPIEKERIDIFLEIMEKTGMTGIEEKNEDNLYTLMTSKDFNRGDVELFVAAFGIPVLQT
ncbi:MAG TPA: hypothetical protein VGK59_18465 [Ohtaekwangia sp.]